MFDFLRRAKIEPAERFAGELQAAQRLIESQISNAEGHASHKKIFDVFACGYIFGFTDAMLTKAGVEDEMELKKLITRTFMKIFGNDPGLKIMGRCMRQQSDQMFRRGQASGTSEAASWRESSGNISPTDLTEYLNSTD